MKVGDLIRLQREEDVGLIVTAPRNHYDDDEGTYNVAEVLFCDGGRYLINLSRCEVINENR
tara:strand:+ start:178 stop:360 length:183 start_codon:yes stop_codon:yes gene_type:complete